MTCSPKDPCHNRAPSPKEIMLAGADYTPIEIGVLEVARYFWQSFAIPQTQAWLRAFERADHHFESPESGLMVLSAVQAMRASRSSCFRFNNPACPSCARIVSEHERQFMGVFRAVRTGREGPARTHAMILCEGNSTDMLLHRMDRLARALAPEARPVPADERRPSPV